MRSDLESLTYSLADYNAVRLIPGTVVEPNLDEVPYVEEIRRLVKDEIPANVSVDWYEALLQDGPGQGDALFDWLATTATKEHLVWFLRQEAAGEAGFDDLVAMTQVKMPNRAKLEMARNYWDEMGRGELAGMHNRLLHGVVEFFDIQPSIRTTLPEPLMLANVMTALACHRRYAYLSVGALGVIEMTAPGRVAKVDAGLERIGVPRDARRYFTLHATLDVKHSREWNREVVEPLADEHIRDIAEGAYLRLWLGKQCFERYRIELGVSP